MNIDFFDDPLEGPKPRKDVRIKQIGLFIYKDRRRLAFGVELTRFLERPSLEVSIKNNEGRKVGSLNVIETLTPNFSLTMHLREDEPAEPYTLTAVVYYKTPETEREDVDQQTVTFTTAEAGERIFKFD